MDREAVPIPAGAAGARVGSRLPRVNKRKCFWGEKGALAFNPIFAKICRVLEPKAWQA